LPRDRVRQAKSLQEPHGGGNVVAVLGAGIRESVLACPGSIDWFRLHRKDTGRTGVEGAVTVGAAAAWAGETPTALTIRTSTPRIRLALSFNSASIPLRVRSIYHPLVFTESGSAP
jgi:hypothetical protein